MSIFTDEYFMLEALKEARKAYDKDEVPVGCVIVCDNQIIGRGHNSVEELQDSTAHAEILCIGAAASALGNWRLLDATLYCTLEPCCMCVGAMFLSRLSRVVWGAPDIRVGAGGSWINLFKEKHPLHHIDCCGGVLAEESKLLMKQFFSNKRNKQDCEE